MYKILSPYLGCKLKTHANLKNINIYVYTQPSCNFYVQNMSTHSNI